MSNLVVSGGHILTPVGERFANVIVRDGRIVELADVASDNCASGENSSDAWRLIDASGCYVTPGLVDLQVNGDAHCDLWGTPSDADLGAMRSALARAGVTSFLPTLITGEIKHLRANVDMLTERGAGVQGKWSLDSSGARMVGIHLEGPCLSEKRPGVHPTEFIIPPSIDVFAKLVNGSVRLVTMASERDADNACAKWLEGHNVVVSIGHSNATYAEAKSAFDGGVRMMTHTFNAMAPLHHREPGAVSAALLDDRVSCCLIADGLHLSPQAVELIYRMKGADKVILVTDIAHVGTTGGGLVGSSITLDVAVRNLVNWGVTGFREAILMASYNAARSIGLENEIGNICQGALADLVLWDKETLAIKQVVMGGKFVNDLCPA